jgi:hypothetical protein
MALDGARLKLQGHRRTPARISRSVKKTGPVSRSTQVPYSQAHCGIYLKLLLLECARPRGVGGAGEEVGRLV